MPIALMILGKMSAACAADTLDRAAAALGVLTFHLGLRRRVVQENMRRVFPGKAPWQRRMWARTSYASVAASFLGLAHWGAQGKEAAARAVSLAAPQHLQQSPVQGAAVWLTAHCGSWDLAGAYIARIAGRCQAYATPQHNRKADHWINMQRQGLGMEVVLAAHGDRRGALGVIKGLRSGIPVGLLADQGPPRERGIGAWFLGQAVSCHQGPAFFALRSQVPLIPTVVLRRRSGRYVFYHGRPILPADFQDEESATQHCLDLLSALVVSVPGQYFWQHRRFKYPMPASLPASHAWRQGVSLWLRPEPDNR